MYVEVNTPMKGNKFWPVILVSAALLFTLSACSLLSGKAKPVEEQVFGVMDTDISIKAYGPNAKEAIEKAIQ